MIISSLILVLASQVSSEPVASTSPFTEWVRCVENFAIDQVRSGESAETLVSAGESECAEEFGIFERSVELEVMSSPAVIEALRSVPRADVERLANDSIARRITTARERGRAAALRNVVFVKARIAEIEGQ